MDIAAEFDAYRSRYEAISETILARTVTVEAAGGDIAVEATLTGTLNDLRISPHVLRRLDSESLAQFLLAAVNEALTRGAQDRLEELRPLIGATADVQDA